MTTTTDKLPQPGAILYLNDLAGKLDVSSNYLKNSLYRYPNRENAYKRVEKFKTNGDIRVLHKLVKSRKGKGHTPIRNLQYLAYEWLQNEYQPSSCCHGFVKDRSVVSNARIHSGKKMIIKTDIKNFFPSIHYGRVKGMFTKHPFHFGPKAASALARICCLPKSEGGALPQGGITSPYIANMLCRKLDYRLMKLAESKRMLYSRYADDLTFSTNAYVDVADFLSQVEEILQDEGFQIHPAKTRVMKPADRQVVTGIILNDCLNVNRRYLKRLRAILYNMELNGVEDTCHKAAFKQQGANFDTRALLLDSKIPDRFLCQIRGQIEWVNQVLKPYRDAPQIHLHERYERAFKMLERITKISDDYRKTKSSFYLLKRAFRDSQQKRERPWRNISDEELLDKIKVAAKSDPRFIHAAKNPKQVSDGDYKSWAKKQRDHARYPALSCKSAARLLSGLTNSNDNLLGRIVHLQDNAIERREIIGFLNECYFPIMDKLTFSLNEEISKLLRIALYKSESCSSKSYDYWNDEHFRNSIILPFKQRFRLSTNSKDDTGTYYHDYFTMIGEKHFKKATFAVSKLKFAIYCDTNQLRDGLNRICESMDRHTRSQTVGVSFRIQDQYKSIHVHDANVDPVDLLPSRDELAHGKLRDAVYKLNGCCHYYITANFAEQGWKRINMMDATQDSEPCDPQPGFTHELRFPG
jgi:hypothetical protein